MRIFVQQGVHQKCSLELLVTQLAIINSVIMVILFVYAVKDAFLICTVILFVIQNVIILNVIFKIMSAETVLQSVLII